MLRLALITLTFLGLSACHGFNFEARRVVIPRFPTIDAAEAHLKRFRECRSCDLRQVAFSYADLSGVDLRNAQLHGCDLTMANLRGAKLQGAILKRCNLSSSADLTGADLSGADLSGAKLNGAILAQAKLCGATMPDGTKVPPCQAVWVPSQK